MLQNNPVLEISGTTELKNELREKILTTINIHRGQEISISFYYGFKQLMEVAVKSLSPGINDPGTAVISLRALFQLLMYRLKNHPKTHYHDNDGTLRIIINERNFESLFNSFVTPIWDYGKADYLIQNEMKHLLQQIKLQGSHPVLDAMYLNVEQAIATRTNTIN